MFRSLHSRKRSDPEHTVHDDEDLQPLPTHLYSMPVQPDGSMRGRIARAIPPFVSALSENYRRAQPFCRTLSFRDSPGTHPIEPCELRTSPLANGQLGLQSQRVYLLPSPCPEG